MKNLKDLAFLYLLKKQKLCPSIHLMLLLSLTHWFHWMAYQLKMCDYSATSDTASLMKLLIAPALITQRIASAFSKFNELKHVLTDKRIYLKTRVNFLTACVRSRLTFSVQACLLTAAETTKLKTVWMNFLRKLLRRGFQRVNVPPESRRRGSRRSRQSTRSTHSEADLDTENEEDLDWRYTLRNEEVFHKKYLH